MVERTIPNNKQYGIIEAKVTTCNKKMNMLDIFHHVTTSTHYPRNLLVKIQKKN